MTRKRNLPLIEVETLPNGYALRCEGGEKLGYMYFTPEELLDGFLLRVGLEMTGQFDTQKIKEFVQTAMNWRENKDCVKEIRQGSKRMEILRARCARIARQLIIERNHYIELFDALEKMIKELKGYPDKDIVERLKVVKGSRKVGELTMDRLGVEDVAVPDDEEEE